MESNKSVYPCIGVVVPLGPTVGHPPDAKVDGIWKLENLKVKPLVKYEN
jgi:hypothetical protein